MITIMPPKFRDTRLVNQAVYFLEFKQLLGFRSLIFNDCLDIFFEGDR